jgi:hypothetical protein
MALMESKTRRRSRWMNLKNPRTVHGRIISTRDAQTVQSINKNDRKGTFTYFGTWYLSDT